MIENKRRRPPLTPPRCSEIPGRSKHTASIHISANGKKKREMLAYAAGVLSPVVLTTARTPTLTATAVPYSPAAPLQQRSPLMRLRSRDLICCSAAEPMPFDDMLEAILAEAEKAASMDAVLDGWMDKLDETFIPSLGN